MDSEHRASGQHSPPPWSDSPDTGSLSSNAQSRFISRTISTASLNSITRLPRYSVNEGQQPLHQEVDAITLRDDDLYTHHETTPSQFTANDSVKTPSAQSAPPQDNSNVRASVSSLSLPQYSSISPRYSSVLYIPAQNLTAEGLPRTEHTYNICSGLKNKPWATFRVFSDPPVGVVQNHQKFPRFSGGDKIAGLIELTLDNSQTVNSITVSLRGRIIRGYLAGESETFLDHQVSIWTRASGDPRFLNQGSTKKFDGKLKGAYQFPFTFPFPTHLDLSTSTTIFLPLQTPSDTPPRSSPPSTPASPSASSSFPSTASPRTSRFRSLSSPMSTSFTSPSMNAASVHKISNHQFIACPLGGIPPNNMPLGSGRRKKSFSQEKHQNEVDSFPVPNPSAESEKARLKRTMDERDRVQARVEDDSSKSLSAHVYPLPQTFLERGIHANVQYELGLHIAHGMLRPASKLKTAIVYTPSIIPASASVARQLAHTEGTPLPGPTVDPDGWQTLPKVMVYGELLGRRKVEVGCTLSLAKPLCYTRGAIIPCYLTLESSNSHALGLLSTPKSPFVRLTRRVRYTQDVTLSIENISSESSTSFSALAGDSASPTAARFSGTSRHGGKDINMASGGERGDMTQEVDEVELAVWRIPPNDAPPETYLKRLEGEIHLAKDLQPTCTFPLFSVEYAVEMLPLVSHGSGSISSEQEQCLLVQAVEIATHHPKEGPIPTAFSEPTSDREREKRKREREKEKEQVEITTRIGYCGN